MGDRKQTTAKIPLELWKQTKKQCAEEEIDLAEAINKGLEMWLKAARAAPKSKAV